MALEPQMIHVKMPDGSTLRIHPNDTARVAELVGAGGVIVGGVQTKVVAAPVEQPKPRRRTAKKAAE